MKYIYPVFIIISIILIFFGFREFNSGGRFENRKIIVACAIITVMIIIKVFFPTRRVGYFKKKDGQP